MPGEGVRDRALKKRRCMQNDWTHWLGPLRLIPYKSPASIAPLPTNFLVLCQASHACTCLLNTPAQHNKFNVTDSHNCAITSFPHLCLWIRAACWKKCIPPHLYQGLEEMGGNGGKGGGGMGKDGGK